MKQKIERLKNYMEKQNPQTKEMQFFKKGYLQALYDVIMVIKKKEKEE